MFSSTEKCTMNESCCLFAVAAAEINKSHITVSYHIVLMSSFLLFSHYLYDSLKFSVWWIWLFALFKGSLGALAVESLHMQYISL